MAVTALFAPGTKVMIRSERSQVGITQGEPRKYGGEYWYTVFFATGDERKIPETNLEIFRGDTDVETLLEQGAFGEKETLSKIVTYTKLSTSLHNNVYAFLASRTKFYSFQFKPLVKFLDSQKQRLLISDEVGLGKTIEAGLIIAEQRARHPLDRVLIVCPSSLCTK